MRVLQRLVMPVDRDLDVLKLYVEGKIFRGREAVPADEAEFKPRAQIDLDEETTTGRRSVVVPYGRRVSFCTYFNAFPASYWRRWSTVEEIELHVRLRGEGILVVYRSNSKGNVQRVKSINFDAPDEPATYDVTLPLRPFIDGGWYWFDVLAGDSNVVVDEAEWRADTDARQGTATIGITTYNRPGFCVEQLVALGDAPEVLDVVDEILVIDQGTQKVADHPDFAAAKQALGMKLRVIDQANLGGSGGFARAMYETLQGERSDYVLLLDDDVVTEPEGILRAVAFGDLARNRIIVGGHMFNLFDRSVLHTFGEGVERYRWFYRPAPHTHYGHNFAVHDLCGTHWMHRRVDVDYNAWWMCLVPTDVIKKVGLALPFFIKWDDAEYGVRAGRAGFPTVSLPGAAVWHVPWHDKDDTIDWQAYYHARNRIIAALLHSPYDRGGNLVKESLFIAAKHAIAMQYSTAELILMAVEDVLSGPGHMHASLASRIDEIRTLRASFPDAQSSGDIDAFPAVRRKRPPRKGRELPAPPEGRRAMVKAALGGVVKQLSPTGDLAKRHPELTVPHLDQKWWLLAHFDSALVSSADGTQAAWYRKDPVRFRSLAQRGSILHARLLKEWPRLREEYRAAMGDLVAPDTWAETFKANS